MHTPKSAFIAVTDVNDEIEIFVNSAHVVAVKSTVHGTKIWLVNNQAVVVRESIPDVMAALTGQKA